MSLLSDKERNQLEDDLEQQIGNHAFDAIERAILAKLASAELPEPAYVVDVCVLDRAKKCCRAIHCTRREGVYTAAQLQQAHAQGFAAGAAAQLAEKPSGYLSQYNLEMLKQGYPQTIVMLEGAKRDVALYTRREA